MKVRYRSAIKSLTLCFIGLFLAFALAGSFVVRLICLTTSPHWPAVSSTASMRPCPPGEISFGKRPRRKRKPRKDKE